MAVEYIEKLVKLNLGATAEQFAEAVAPREDDAAQEGQFDKTGAAALRHFLDRTTEVGTACFFFFEVHDSRKKGAPVVEPTLRCAGPTMPAAGASVRSMYFLKNDPVVPLNGSPDELLNVMQFGICTGDLLGNMAGLLRELSGPAYRAAARVTHTPGTSPPAPRRSRRRPIRSPTTPRRSRRARSTSTGATSGGSRACWPGPRSRCRATCS